MRSYWLVKTSVIIITMLLAACGSASTSVVPSITPTVQPTDVPTSTSEAVTATPEQVTESVPTPDAPPVEGALAWRDQVLRNDMVFVSIAGLPDPGDDAVYAAWLSGSAGDLPLGVLAATDPDRATLMYASPTQENLLGLYDQVSITQVSPDEADSAMTNVVMRGALPEEALVPIRHILYRIDTTPDQTGLVLGLRQETEELLRHAQFLQESFDVGDFALEKAHAEHIINIIRGSEARDVNGDGKVQNPGDGYGLLPNGQQDGYIKGMVDQARLAATASDATEDIKLHASHVQIAGENTRVRVEELRTLAERIAAAATIDETRQDVLALLALAHQTIQGVDINLDEQIGPVPGEGGVLTAYQHAQFMAGIPLALETEDTSVTPAQPVQTAAAPAQEIVIDINDNRFAPRKITVPLGATVVWRHGGQGTHTVTADDGSFDSGSLASGDTFSFTFDQAGTFPYHCSFHGGPVGEGMSGAIVVAATSAPPAEPIPAATPAIQDTATEDAATDDAEILIGDNRFVEDEIRIPVGATVVWTHAGQRPHTVTADDGSFDSGTLNSGDTFSFTFDQAGVYPYYCELHGASNGGGMAGVVIVGDAAQTPDATEPSASAYVTVSMEDFAFVPSEVRIKAGTTVTWENVASRQHSATGVDGTFDTGLFEPNDVRSFTFDQPGTYPYFCQIHGSVDGLSGMVGVVVVEP